MTLIGFGLRAWKSDWALPYVPHPDEPAIMNTVLRMLREGDPNPHFFYYPSLWIYVQAAIGFVHLQWGTAQGMYSGAAQLPETTDIATSVPGFFAWGRIATALAGALTIPALYAVTQRLAGSVGGLIAAALLTVNALHLIHSHYIMTDVPSELFTALGLLFVLRIADRGSWRDYVLAGLMGGLAAGAKHHAALLAVPIVVAHVLFWRGRSLNAIPRLFAAAGSMIAIFLLTSPFIVLAWDEFWADLSHQLGDYAAGAHGDITGAWPMGYYLDFFRDRAVGGLALLLALWGTARLIRKRDPAVVIVWSLVLVYLLVFLPQGNHWMRNVMPVQIPLFALAGTGAADLLHRVEMIASRRAVGSRFAILPATAVLLAPLLIPPSIASARYLQRLTRGDSRVQILQWIDANVPPGVQIAAEWKPVPGAGDPRWTEVHYLPERDLRWYRQQGYAYVVASSDTWRQIAIPNQYVAWAGDQPLIEFGDPGGTMLGPRLVVYSTQLGPGDVPERPAGDARFDGVRLLGATIGKPDPDDPRRGVDPAREFKTGSVIGIRTWWQVEQPLTTDYFVFVHLRDADGTTVAQRDAPPWQGRFPTSTWRDGTIVVDVNDLALPALPPGEYQLVAGLFDPATGGAPPLTMDGQPQPGNTVALGTIRIVE
jgi:4-amino-4-deoxy-L-arabinose transferase-like glycosyltransferase